MSKSFLPYQSLLPHLILLLLSLFPQTHTTTLFNYQPDTRVFMGNYQPTKVRISYDSKQIAVGFMNGTITVFSIRGVVMYNMTGCHSVAIKEIKEIRLNGWVSLDTANRACRWDAQGVLTWSWNFTNLVYGMTVTQHTYGFSHIAFNFWFEAQQFHSQHKTSTPIKTYKPIIAPQRYFDILQYDQYGKNLYASTSKYDIDTYDCERGQYLGVMKSPQYYVKGFSLVSNGDILFTDGSIIYWHKEGELDVEWFFVRVNHTAIATSYRNGQTLSIVTTLNVSTVLYVFDQNGGQIQTLTFSTYKFKAIDANDNHLVTVDNYGFLSVVSFMPEDGGKGSDGEETWVIVGIVLGVVVILGIVIAVRVVRNRRRKMALLNGGGYNRFENNGGSNQNISNQQNQNQL